MTFAGIDYDSSSIDVVRLELDTDTARHDRILLDSTGKLDAFERARRVRNLMPPRGAWADDGVVTIALEDPKSRSFAAATALARVQGAILACLPESVAVISMPPYEWKIAVGVSGNAKKELVREWALRTWPNLPERYTQDALDAYAIAWAARAICEKAAAA